MSEAGDGFNILDIHGEEILTMLSNSLITLVYRCLSPKIWRQST